MTSCPGTCHTTQHIYMTLHCIHMPYVITQHVSSPSTSMPLPSTRHHTAKVALGMGRAHVPSHSSRRKSARSDELPQACPNKTTLSYVILGVFFVSRNCKDIFSRLVIPFSASGDSGHDPPLPATLTPTLSRGLLGWCASRSLCLEMLYFYFRVHLRNFCLKGQIYARRPPHCTLRTHGHWHGAGGGCKHAVKPRRRDKHGT